jgi:hypothetical protein
MSEQPLSNKIGNAVGTCKRRLLDQLKAGANVEQAVAQFLYELQQELRLIVRNLKSPSVEQ